ncbi:MAG: Cna B-type domain-containing protein, partial [Tissierellia bacterium]|nr:Cna B-type domain-containing protein [Tissierellia bacterium]
MRGYANKNRLRNMIAFLMSIMVILGSFGNYMVKAVGDNPDENFIVVEKKFTGIEKENIPEDFEITVTSSGKRYLLNSKNRLNTSTDDIWRWKIANAALGRYDVSESNAKIENYILTTRGLGVVEVKPSSFELTDFIRNTENAPLDWPVGVSGNISTFFSASLTGKYGKGTVVITKNTLSASDRERVKTLLNKIDNLFIEPYYFFSIDAQGSKFNVKGAKIEYFKDGYPGTNESFIRMDRKDIWQHIILGKYNITEAENPEISIENLYELNLTSVQGEKTWDDANNQDGKRPESITIRLLADGK